MAGLHESRVPLQRPAWRSWVTGALDLIYPPVCVACGGDGGWFCARCVTSIRRIEPPWCPLCGHPGDGISCLSCRQKAPIVRPIIAYAMYEGALAEAVKAFKFEGLTVLAPQLGEFMADAWKRYGMPVDVVVPVPLHLSRARSRGYNQSALLAAEIGRVLGIRIGSRILLKHRNTPNQVGLPAEERRSNLKGVFSVRATRKHELIGKTVLVCDDVCTTTATLDECAAVLRRSGARAVSGLTLARSL